MKRTLGIMLFILLLRADMSYSQSSGEYFKKGVDYGSQGKLREAYREFGEALTADRFYFPAQRGIRLIKDVTLKRVEKEAGIHLFAGMAHLAEGKWDEAMNECESALAVISRTVLAHETSRDDYARNNRWAEFIAETKKISALNFEFVLAHEILGRAYEQKGLWDAAVAEYKKSIDIDSRSAAAREALGRAYEQKGMLDAAVAEYKKAIDIDPEFVSARKALGGVYEQKRMRDEAVAEYKKAIDIDSDFVAAREALGRVYEQKGMRDEAMAEYEKAVGIDPKFVAAREALGGVYAQKGMWDEAMAEYEKAVGIDPKFVAAREALGRVYEHKEMWDEAISEHKEAVAIRPDFYRARDNLFAAYAARGDLAEVARLLDAGVPVNVRVANCWTALMRASFYGHADIVKLLLAKGAEVDIKTCGGETRYTKTIRAGHSLSAESVDTAEAAALILAAQKGHADVAGLLLDAGAEKDGKTKNGQTALSLAAQNDHYGVVELLLEKGADVNAGAMVLDNVVYPDVVKLLLEHGADINAADSAGATALHQAARDGNFEVVKVLLEKGADPNAVVPGGESVLFQAAVLGGNSDVVKVLIDKGADANFRDKNRSNATILHVLSTYPLSGEDLNIMKVLIEKGADVNARADMGLTSWNAVFSRDVETALGMAIRLRHPETVKLLLEKGAAVSWIQWPLLLWEKLAAEKKDAGTEEIWRLLIHSRAQHVIWAEQVAVLIATGYASFLLLGAMMPLFNFLHGVFLNKLSEPPKRNLSQKYDWGLLFIYGAILIVCFIPKSQESEERGSQMRSDSLTKRKEQELRERERTAKMKDMQKAMLQSRRDQMRDLQRMQDLKKALIEGNL